MGSSDALERFVHFASLNCKSIIRPPSAGLATMVSPNGDAFACPISEIDEPPGAQKNQARTETRPHEGLDAEDLRRFAKHQAELAMSDGSPRTRRARRRQLVREAEEARAIFAKPTRRLYSLDGTEAASADRL